MKIHHKIRAAREKQRMTQQEIAEYINVNQNTYHNIESGISSLKLEHFIKICEKLNLNPAEMLTYGTGAEDIEPTIFKRSNQNIESVVGMIENQLQIKDNQINKMDEHIEGLIKFINNYKSQ